VSGRPDRDTLLRQADTVDACSFAEAKIEQLRLASSVNATGGPRNVRLIAGYDCAFAGDNVVGAITVHAWPSLEIVHRQQSMRPLGMPYVPGFLSFRELPVLLQATASLPDLPDLIIVDGCGQLHPRRFGLACHLGLALDLPTIGNAKSLLCGKHRTVAEPRGSRALIRHRHEAIGMALRTRTGVKPVFVSAGHRISLASAYKWILKTAPNYRLPEPIRAADKLSKSH
jgi:deoxyribonuclease V